MDSLVKEIVESKNFQRQNIQKIRDIMNRSNLQIIGIEEGE